ncbi:hypothetical protein PHET_11606 [Paragonimus heterotremus]|uniref:Uncharacterized protein n=1 Tax=Paragonimus heterotremus TaxID=100268 RepID=A0A8J4SJD2_9TREM|nr:hypothetical protein PHET_11606 [Paragonimus heterotremus]
MNLSLSEATISRHGINIKLLRKLTKNGMFIFIYWTS